MNTWTTREGKVIDVKHMDSVHLVHSLNMVIRAISGVTSMNHRLRKIRKSNQKHLLVECERRGLLVHLRDFDTQFEIPRRRESTNQLTYMAAILNDPKSKEAYWKIFNSDIDAAIGHIEFLAQQGDELASAVIARATAFRLTK